MFNHKYPYTDFHELNIDFVLKEMQKLKQEIKTLQNRIQKLEEEEGE